MRGMRSGVRDKRRRRMAAVRPRRRLISQIPFDRPGRREAARGLHSLICRPERKELRPWSFISALWAGDDGVVVIVHRYRYVRLPTLRTAASDGYDHIFGHKILPDDEPGTLRAPAAPWSFYGSEEVSQDRPPLHIQTITKSPRANRPGRREAAGNQRE